MRWLLTIGLLVAGLTGIAQADSTLLKEAVQKLEKALLVKDTSALNLLLDKKLSYGHSNGWVQSKKDVRDDFSSGKIEYNSIESGPVSILSLDDESATVTMQTKATGQVNGKPFELNLHVMQVWKKDKKGWQLLARQSAKLAP